jgi:lipid-A-disaccharide synthase
MKRLLVSAGEASGDEAAARVLAALANSVTPTLSAFGLAGNACQAKGLRLLMHCEATARMASLGALGLLPRLSLLQRKLTRAHADAALLVSYSSFNTALLHSLKKRQTPTVFYAPPQIWAWHASRGAQIAKSASCIATVLPFEQTLWEGLGARSVYVGHPATEAHFDPVAKPSSERYELGLFAGSRVREVRAHLPLMLEAAAGRGRTVALLARNLPKAVATEAEALCRRRGVHTVRQSDMRVADLARMLDAAVCVSGTVSLELALASVPTVVVYRTDAVTAWLARRLLRVPFIALPNLILGRELYPELVLDAVTPRAIASALDDVKGQSADAHFARLRSLTIPKVRPSERVAELLLEYL